MFVSPLVLLLCSIFLAFGLCVFFGLDHKKFKFISGVVFFVGYFSLVEIGVI